MYTPITLEELKARQKEVDDKLANTQPSHTHRVRGQWIKTKNFKPWFNGKADCPVDVNTP